MDFSMSGIIHEAESFAEFSPEGQGRRGNGECAGKCGEIDQDEFHDLILASGEPQIKGMQIVHHAAD